MTKLVRVFVSAPAVVLLAALLISVTGCGQDVAEDLEPYDPDREYTISIGAFGELEDAYTAVAETDEFQERFPNVELEFQTADFDGHHERLTTTIAAGEATNHIESLEVEFIAQFVEGGGLYDLSDEPFNGFEAGEGIVDFAMANATTFDDRLVAMPVDIAPAVLFYRADMVEEAGISEEEMQNISDWDEFIEIAEALTKDTNDDGNIDQFALPTAAEVADVPIGGGKGGWIDENEEPLEPRERFIEVLELVQNVRQAGVDADLGAWSEEWVQAFSDGTVAMTANGAWFGGALQTWIAPDVEDWRVAHLPEYASIGGTYLSIPETVPSDKVLPAWEVIEFLTTHPEAQLTTFRTIDAFPALTEVFDHEVMDEEVEYYGGQQVRQIFAEVSENHPILNVSEFDAEIVGIWGTVVSGVIEGDLTIEEAYDQALQQVRGIM